MPQEHEIEMKERVIAERDTVVDKLERTNTHEHLSLKEEVIKGRDKAINVGSQFLEITQH